MRALLLVLLLLPGLAGAAGEPADFAWQQRPGAQLPLDTVLRDEAGQEVRLGAALGATPVILDLGYFHCPALCGVVRADLLQALRTSGLRPGVDYTLLALSIDPAETPADATSAKAADGAAGRYWTGSAGSIAAIEQAVGFRARYDAAFKQFLHPAGVVVLDKAGAVNGYLLGVGYSGGDLRAAVLRAGEGGLAQATLPVLLLCFHYDPTTGRYTLAIEKLLRLMGVLTVVTLGGLLFVLHRHRPGAPP